MLSTLYVCYVLLAFLSCFPSCILKHLYSHENFLHVSGLESSIAKRMSQSLSCYMHMWKECVSKHDTFTLTVVFWTNIKIAFTLKGRHCRIPRSWSAVQYYADSNIIRNRFIVKSNSKDVKWPRYRAHCGRRSWILRCWMRVPPPFSRLGLSALEFVSCNTYFVHIPVALQLYIIQSCDAVSCKHISVNCFGFLFGWFFSLKARIKHK